MSAAENDFSAVAIAIATVQARVGAVEKRGENKFHGYKFATAADMLHKLQPLMADAGLIVIHTEADREFIENGAVLAIRYQFTLAHISGAVWPDRPVLTGMASCRNTKGGFDDKAANKCLTAAHKYFLLTLFKIPTGDYDDADAEEDKGRTREKPAGRPTASAARPSHDPQTGEVHDDGPNNDINSEWFIDIGDGRGEMSWKRFIEDFRTQLAETKTPTDVVKLQSANALTLKRLSEQGERGEAAYDKLHARIMSRKAELSNGAGKSDGDNTVLAAG